MRKFIFSMIGCVVIPFFSLTISFNGFGQQFYFPGKLYSDSNALYKALPRLADELAMAYKDSNKSVFYKNAYYYQIAAAHYNMGLQFIDSARKYSEDNPGSKMVGFQTGSYALAKQQSIDGNVSFEQVYKNNFPRLYNGLSDYEKIHIEFDFDSVFASSDAENFHKTIDSLRLKNSDSISLNEARNLTQNYIMFVISKTIFRLARPFLDQTTQKITYPLIKSSKWSGIAPVAIIDEIPDPKIQYNLLMEVVSGIQNKQDTFNIKNVNGGLSEVARILNLHIGAGIPKKNIHIVAVVHAAALYALLNNESYQKRYKINNPNLVLLKELKDAGTKFIACGQAMYFFNVKKEEMIPGVKISLTAQTVLSSYLLKNYVHYMF